MPTVFISSDGTFDPPAPYTKLLESAGFTLRYPDDPKFPLAAYGDDKTIEQLDGAVAVIAWGERYNERVLDALPQLRVIARAGVGLNSVDVAAATAHNVVVTVTPTANHEAVAEHALALIFAVAKSIVLEDRAVRSGKWPRGSHRPVRGETLGIVGLGRIGRSTALRALALGMKVVAYDKYPDPGFAEQHNVELVEFDELLARSDYVSLHCPLLDDTRGIINRRSLAKMKPGAVLINTSRGALVTESDLIEALQSGHIWGAGLDVFEQEPTPESNPLLQFDNVVVSAHTAGIDRLSVENMGLEAAQCIVDLKEGRWPENAAVNNELREKWKW